jgi:DNA-binding MurR/RpiR family transcriptional regulator
MTEQKAREQKLIFTGHFSKEKEDILVIAKTYRDNGVRAVVVTKTYKGRITSSVGYSVYAEKDFDIYSTAGAK